MDKEQAQAEIGRLGSGTYGTDSNSLGLGFSFVNPADPTSYASNSGGDTSHDAVVAEMHAEAERELASRHPETAGANNIELPSNNDPSFISNPYVEKINSEGGQHWSSGADTTPVADNRLAWRELPELGLGFASSGSISSSSGPTTGDRLAYLWQKSGNPLGSKIGQTAKILWSAGLQNAEDFDRNMSVGGPGGPRISVGFGGVTKVVGRLPGLVNEVVDVAANSARFGNSLSNDYRATFFAENPELHGQVVVHHAVEQQVLTRYPGVVSEAEIHSIENLRGIPNELNSDLHLSQIRREWNQFYRQTPNPSKEMFLQKATEIDAKFGTQFNPPIGP